MVGQRKAARRHQVNCIQDWDIQDLIITQSQQEVYKADQLTIHPHKFLGLATRCLGHLLYRNTFVWRVWSLHVLSDDMQVVSKKLVSKLRHNATTQANRWIMFPWQCHNCIGHHLTLTQLTNWVFDSPTTSLAGQFCSPSTWFCSAIQSKVTRLFPPV